MPTHRQASVKLSSPKLVFKASINKLKRYVRDYRQMYGSFYNIMAWHPALLQIANAMLTQPLVPENKYYLDFCLDEHVRFSFQFPLAIAVLEG